MIFKISHGKLQGLVKQYRRLRQKAIFLISDFGKDTPAFRHGEELPSPF
jgi:hypothetical protein